MNNKILDFLCCPECNADFNLKALKQNGIEVESGFLVCQGCGVRYPIIDSIPRILPAGIIEAERKTAGSFEFAWRHYGYLISNNLNSEFLALVKPWKETDFVDKTVLDVGCGAGRLSRLASRYGAKHVFSIDLGKAVDAAYNLSGEYSNIHFLQSSLYSLPFKIKFDIIFSLGVLHHTPYPHLGFQNILKFVKEGGRIGIWVYGKEGNEITGPLLSIFRVITTRLNHNAKVSAARFIVRLEEVFYQFISKFSDSIFYGEYLKYFNTKLSRIDREYVAFDFMSTHLVKYISKRELEDWVVQSSLADVLIVKRNFNSWSLTARKGD